MLSASHGDTPTLATSGALHGYWLRMRIRKACAAGLLTVGLLAGSSLAASPAFADAYGTAYWGPVEVQDLTLPSGQLFGAVEGHGTRIDMAGGNFVAAGNLCQSYVEVALIDPDGNEYNSFHEDPSNCSHVGGVKYDFDGMEMENGSKISIRLLADNGRRELARVTHNIEDYTPWYRW